MSEHYFSETPDGPDERREITVRLAGRELDLQVSSGVFSPGRLDPGTAVLLGHVPAPPAEGVFADIGCGWGPIAVSLALVSPSATVWAVDVNRRSLDLTAANAARVGARGVRTATPDEVPDDVRLDVIWSNPPIRVGKQVLHELLHTWLPRLAPGGTAWLVVQKNLGSDSLQRWIGTELGDVVDVDRYASSKGYRVLRCTRH